jgi:2-hydroxy-3-oxopropionate reductase
MALNLTRAGYRLAVYARRPDSAKPLLQAGAAFCTSPRDLAVVSDILITMVSDSPDVEAVVLGEQGVVEGIRSGSLVVDMTTAAPSCARHLAALLAEHRVDFLDAPVSGGERGAVEGTLSIMVGGPPEAFARAKPMLEVLGRNVVHVGGCGAGQIAKACNQLLVAQTLNGVAEALLLAQRAGVDPARVREALLGGFAYSRILEAHGSRMLQRDFQPGFKARLHQKDMAIVLETARQLGIGLPGAALAAQYMNALVGGGRGELDSAAILTVLEAMAGLASD